MDKRIDCILLCIQYFYDFLNNIKIVPAHQILILRSSIIL